jgi:hypothetical protein
MLREHDDHFDQARLYDFCNCITTHGHVRERLILALGGGLPLPSFFCVCKLAPAWPVKAVQKKRAARRRPVSKTGPPSWGGEDDKRVKGPSEGCSQRPEGALARFFFGAECRV